MIELTILSLQTKRYSLDYSQYEIYDFDRISAFNLSSDDLSQASMAQMAGISKDYFSRIFKSITGLNYNKWINTIRLEKATELLSSENMPLTEVAMLSGFRSIPSFNRVFREEKGMTPGEYRTLFDRRENHEH